ncbi:transposable element Tcb1 transposase [Trichonephila clavipes]|nr:transposable element Tcb1 transposase [Trichonephila clavipes]
MDWPAYSPDLNPIEQVLDMLCRRIAAHQPPPTCLPELRRPLLDEWCNIPQDQIDNLILSMPRHYEVKAASQESLLEVAKRTSSCAFRNYTNPDRRVSSPNGTTRCCELFRDNNIPMPTCTAKFCRVLSSVIAPATFDREKTSLRLRTGCNSWIERDCPNPGESRRSVR